MNIERKRPRGPMVKTPDFDSENPGSNPGAAATLAEIRAYIEFWRRQPTSATKTEEILVMAKVLCAIGQTLNRYERAA